MIEVKTAENTTKRIAIVHVKTGDNVTKEIVTVYEVCDPNSDGTRELEVVHCHHNWVPDERYEPAENCGDHEVTGITCTRCNTQGWEIGEMLDHEYEVTMIEGGVTTYTCIHCGDEYSEGEVWCTCDNPTDGGTSGPYTICGNCGGITGV